MKKTLGIVLMIVAMLAVTVPAFAQLGDCDNSSFSIQNLGSAEATVTVTFYDDTGASFTPTPLDGIGTPNPFPLAAGAQYQVYVPGIASLGDGRYSVVIESTEPVAVIANLIGYTGNCGPGNWPAFNGSYSGFDAGSGTYYLPSVVYAYSNWNSLISVQNVTADPIDITVTIKDPRGNPDVPKSYSAVPGFSSVNLDMQTEGAGLGLVAGLNGSAIVEATGAIVVTDNQSAYGGGNGLTQSYNGFGSGATVFYAPALYNMFPAAGGWRSSINIQNIGSEPTDVEVTFSDGGVPMACEGLEAGASCLVSMVNRTDGNTEFSGVITSSSQDIVAIVNASNGNKKEAQTYTAIAQGSGTDVVNFPLVMDAFPNGGGWDTNFLVQNIGSADCDALTINYSDDANTGAIGPTYVVNGPFAPGAYYSGYQPTDPNLPANWYSGSVAVTCNNGQPLGGIVNETNRLNNTSNGDWSMSYNGF